MELKLTRQTITINETVYDGRVEQPIECDALLPDYCPDIVKVLKCMISTHVGTSIVSGDRLTIEGIACAHVYYTSSDGCIRHAEYKIPFAKGIELRVAPVDPAVTVIPSVDYVNCRAVNQRRIDIRGALSLTVKIQSRGQQEVVSDAQGGGLQLRRDMVSASDIAGHVQTHFPVSEDLELGHGKSQIGTVIRSECRVNMHDFKIVAGKVVVKGDFMLHILYQPLDNELSPEVMEYSLPVSQIIDCEGVDEDCVCWVQLMAASHDVQPKASENGEFTVFALDAKIAVQVAAHRHGEVPVASDCYSTKYECGCKHQTVTFIRLLDVVKESIMHKASMDLPEEVATVLDTWCEVDSVNHKQTPEGIEVSMRLTVSMFAKMADGKCLYFDQSTELTQMIQIPTGFSEVSFDPTADVVSCSFSLAGKEKMDLRCEILVSGCVYCTVKQNAIADITVDEQKEKVRDAGKLIIYYADNGESVWDIAKHYNTSANAIWDENAVEQDILPDKRMLLIPIV